MRRQEIRKHALQEATAAELLNAMATTLERLTERVERLEIYVQSIETLLRAEEASNAVTADGKPPAHIVQIGRAVSSGAASTSTPTPNA